MLLYRSIWKKLVFAMDMINSHLMYLSISISRLNVGPICSNITEGMKHACSFVLTGDNQDYHNIALSLVKTSIFPKESDLSIAK